MTVARPRLTTGVTLASAGILALSLVVAAPPDVNGARTEVRAVQFAAFALPPSASPGAILEKLISHQAQTVVPVTSVVDAAADITTAIVTTPRTFVRVEQPTGSPTHAANLFHTLCAAFTEICWPTMARASVWKGSPRGTRWTRG